MRAADHLNRMLYLRRPEKRYLGIDIHVVSPGGSATTLLIEHLAKFAQTNDPFDRDGIKHKLKPCVGCGAKHLFLYDDPDRITRSIERRGWLEIQSRKLGALSFGGIILKRFLFKQAVKRQITNWCNSSDALCLHYDEIWENITKIQDVFGLPEEFVSTFPEKKERES